MTMLDVNIRRKAFPQSGDQAGHLAIKDLRFSMSEGEFVCMIGPSGAGKTTTLNIIAGLDTDFEGAIRFNSGKETPRLAYVFQTPRLLPWRSVTENIELVLDGSELARKTARQLISDVGLADFAHAFPGQMSLGMQRRAALARAFAVKPGILLMDEPFVSLDEAAANLLRILLIKLWRARPTTVLFVTHDMREAVKLATRILILTGAPARVARQIPVPLTPQEREDPQIIESFRREHLSAVGGGISLLPEEAPLNGRSPEAAREAETG